jgi:hypothetical protein
MPATLNQNRLPTMLSPFIPRLKLPGFPGIVKAGGICLAQNVVTIFLGHLDFFLTIVYVYINCILC